MVKIAKRPATMHEGILVWLRRDLRLSDHAALAHAVRDAERVYCAFVFDRAILDPLLAIGARADRRVHFILRSLLELDVRLRRAGSALQVCHGVAADEIPRLAQKLRVGAVYANRDYEPDARARDERVEKSLNAAGRALVTFKDQVIFEGDEILTATGTPYSVFTPYKNAWLRKLASDESVLNASNPDLKRLANITAPAALPSLPDLGFAPIDDEAATLAAGESGAHDLLNDFVARIDRYAQARDFPAVKGPSYLSVHLRFGTVSIRELVRLAYARARQAHGAEVWLSELIWREFYQQILFHHPRVVEHSFRPEYDRIVWSDDETLFAAWCEGRTGYPLVDAAMAQINRTGYMHNRLRMVVASFLVKDLGIDWRWGERYFARHLNDFDLAANNGGWQWAASTGCDAQPYFRIFNPITQSQKFDPDGKFIRRYLPQLGGFSAQEIHAPWLASTARQQQVRCVIGVDYPAPVVDHALARAATLARFAAARQ